MFCNSAVWFRFLFFLKVKRLIMKNIAKIVPKKLPPGFGKRGQKRNLHPKS